MARPRKRRATLVGRPPVRAENRFAAQMAEIDAVTLEFLRAKIIPRLRDGARRREIEPLLRELDALLAVRFSASKIERAARAAATATDLASQRSAFAAISQATGLAVVGSDSGVAAGSALGSTRAGRKVLVARRNVSIDLAIDGFVDDGVRLISTLRKGVAEGVGDAVVRAYTFGPDGGDPAALAERLLASWERKGVPAKIPTRRLNKRGERVFVNAKSHAELIARDQLQKLHGKLEEGRQRAAGVERYRWRTQQDDRVRPAHRAREGQTFEWAKPPPDGHPGEPIMCFPAEQPVGTPGGCKLAIRAEYAGEILRVTLGDASILVTPNHPILTPRGLVRAEDLREGDDLVRVRVRDAGGSGYEDPHEAPIGEVFRFGEVAGARAIRRGDLYGDTIHGQNVDVVTVDRGLAFGGGTPSLESLQDRALAEAHDPRLRLRGSAKAIGRVFRAAAGFVSSARPRLALLGGGLCHALAHPGASISNLDAVLEQHPTESPAADPGFFGERLQGDAFQVSLHKIGKIERGIESSGHVFTLSTPAGWYTASGFVVGNCRCYAEAIVERGAVLASEGFVEVELDRPFSERGTAEGLQLLSPGPGALGQF